VIRHLLKGIARAQLTQADLVPVWQWFDTQPYCPPGEGPGGAGTPRPHDFQGTRKGDWYMRFPKFIAVGNGVRLHQFPDPLSPRPLTAT
jgi:hypothetical protein